MTEKTFRKYLYLKGFEASGNRYNNSTISIFYYLPNGIIGVAAFKHKNSGKYFFDPCPTRDHHDNPIDCVIDAWKKGRFTVT